VEAQQANPSSLLWWTKRLIALRKRFQAFGRGTIEFLYPDNRKVLAFLRCYEDETVLVVANLSRFVQYAPRPVALPRPRARRAVRPDRVPAHRRDPFFVTLGPHAFYWFQLRAPDRGDVVVSGTAGHGPRSRIPRAHGPPAGRRRRVRFEALLPALAGHAALVPGQGPTRPRHPCATCCRCRPRPAGTASLLVDVQYVEEQTETYVLPIGPGRGRPMRSRSSRSIPRAVIAEVPLEEGAPAVIVVDASVLDEVPGCAARRGHGRRG
jgi:maltose alpha-D-glucosyltransferase / alpha-amylase